jgi:hypothetical protein
MGVPHGERRAASCVGLPHSSGRAQFGRLPRTCSSALARFEPKARAAPFVPALGAGSFPPGHATPARIETDLNGPLLNGLRMVVQIFERLSAFPGNNWSVRRSNRRPHCATVCRAKNSAYQLGRRTPTVGATFANDSLFRVYRRMRFRHLPSHICAIRRVWARAAADATDQLARTCDAAD